MDFAEQAEEVLLESLDAEHELEEVLRPAWCTWIS